MAYLKCKKNADDSGHEQRQADGIKAPSALEETLTIQCILSGRETQKE